MLREAVKASEEDNKLLEKNIKKKEEEIEMLKQANQREYKMIQDEIESEENIILELQKQSHLGKEEALKDLRETQKKCDEKYLELDKIERIGINGLNELVNDVVTNMTKQQEQLDDHIAYSKNILQQLLEEEKQQIELLARDKEETNKMS